VTHKIVELIEVNELEREAVQALWDLIVNATSRATFDGDPFSEVKPKPDAMTCE
jgi:hypothetical protein